MCNKIYLQNYKLTNLLDNKAYIRQTVDAFKRARSHCNYSLRGHDSYLYNAIRLHGFDCFKFEIIEVCNDTFVDERERFWISFYDSYNRSKGYKLESGGCRLKTHSPETIEKLSAMKLGHEVSQETRQKIRAAHIGTKASLETRQKMRESRIGYKHDEETLQKISSSRLGQTLSEETRKKISDAKRGHKQSEETVNKRNKKLRGQKRSDESRQKMRKPKSAETRQRMKEAQARRRAERLMTQESLHK